MNNDELKKKIMEILHRDFITREVTPVYVGEDGKEKIMPQKLCDVFNNLTEQALIPYFADALIAAGIGDVSELKKHRILVKSVSIPNDENFYIVPQTEIDIKQLYNGEEVEQIVKERDQYKHRAEVAERALDKACECIANTFNPYWKRDFFKQSYVKEYKTQAEREFSEEGR